MFNNVYFTGAEGFERRSNAEFRQFLYIAPWNKLRLFYRFKNL